MLHLTIDDALDLVGFGKFQYLLLLLSAVGFFSTTIELILMALIKQPLQATWPSISNSSFAWLSALTFAGELLGGLLWGWIGDRLGRRVVFMGTAAMACLFGLLSGWSPCFHLFVCFRFLLGIAIGKQNTRIYRWLTGH